MCDLPLGETEFEQAMIAPAPNSHGYHYQTPCKRINKHSKHSFGGTQAATVIGGLDNLRMSHTYALHNLYPT